MWLKNRKARSVLAVVCVLPTCSETRVGGDYLYRDFKSGSDSYTLTEFRPICDGGCRDFSKSGSCILFQKEIAPICKDYFASIAVTNGDCSPVVSENSGIVSLTYTSC